MVARVYMQHIQSIILQKIPWDYGSVIITTRTKMPG
jgi:hypothetical protein